MEDIEYDYVDVIDSNLICSICRNPFINPMILINCQHTFCLNCLTQSMKMTSLICPIDRSRITSLKDIQPATRLIQLLVEELKIKCDLCQQIMERSLFLIHKLECRHHDVTHGDGGGEGEGEEGEEDQYDHTTTTTTTACTYCQTIINPTTATLPQHYLECNLIPLPCPYARHGCTITSSRHNLTEHVETSCSFAPLAEFFSRYESRIIEMEGENWELKHKSHHIMVEMNQIRSEMEGIKQGMGSFYSGPILVPPTLISPTATSDPTSSTNTSTPPSLSQQLSSLTTTLTSLSLTSSTLETRLLTTLTSETNRFSEEIETLKLITHNLRMQSHYVLMELHRVNEAIAVVSASSSSSASNSNSNSAAATTGAGGQNSSLLFNPGGVPSSLGMMGPPMMMTGGLPLSLIGPGMGMNRMNSPPGVGMGGMMMRASPLPLSPPGMGMGMGMGHNNNNYPGGTRL